MAGVVPVGPSYRVGYVCCGRIESVRGQRRFRVASDAVDEEVGCE